MKTEPRSSARSEESVEGAADHIQKAQRSATKIPDVPAGTALRPIHRIGIVGAGTMGSGIATSFLSAGFPLTMVDTSQAALVRGADVIRRNYGRSVEKGKISQNHAADAFAHLTQTSDFDALSNCDLIIEAVFEDIDIKLDIFRRLGELSRPGSILASNTSFLDVNRMGEASGRPADVLGTHFFSPAHVMKLVEVVRGVKTGHGPLASVMDLMTRINKVPIACGVCHGFIGNRMLMQRQNQAIALLLEGAKPEQIDAIHNRFGMPMGPFQMADLAGLDIGWHRDSSRVESVLDALCAVGRWGQKTNAGYYDYLQPRQPTPSPVTASIIADFRARHASAARSISEEEITARTLYTMINEAAHILEDGIAQRASDIDLVWIFGFGWPAATGGPLCWAEGIGLKTVVDGLRRYGSRLPTCFTISPLLLSCAASGARLERH